MTSGNSETINWNLSFDIGKETRNGHDVKLNGLYLRGKENGKLSVDRLKISLRDDYSISDSIVGYGNVNYKSDPLKGIDYLVNPAGGLGWKIQERDKYSLQADIGAGILLEQENGLEKKTSASINSNQSFTYRLSKTARLRQKLDVLWKADNLTDYLVNVSLSLATKITNFSELQAEFLDDFKNKPANIAYKKNDIALILKYVVRF
jgi:putative salt-induced outer membrane protein YdiY